MTRRAPSSSPSAASRWAESSCRQSIFSTASTQLGIVDEPHRPARGQAALAQARVRPPRTRSMTARTTRGLLAEIAVRLLHEIGLQTRAAPPGPTAPCRRRCASCRIRIRRRRRTPTTVSRFTPTMWTMRSIRRRHVPRARRRLRASAHRALGPWPARRADRADRTPCAASGGSM